MLTDTQSTVADRKPVPGVPDIYYSQASNPHPDRAPTLVSNTGVPSACFNTYNRLSCGSQFTCTSIPGIGPSLGLFMRVTGEPVSTVVDQKKLRTPSNPVVAVGFLPPSLLSASVENQGCTSAKRCTGDSHATTRSITERAVQGGLDPHSQSVQRTCR